MQIVNLDTNETIKISSLKKSKRELVFINDLDKFNSLQKIFQAFFENKKIVLYDKNNTNIENKIDSINLNSIDFDFLFFTSGTTGEPVGAFKSRDNLLQEVEVLAKLILKYRVKRVYVTTPYIHIYGVLTALLLPFKLNIDIFVKEQFLPNELIEAKSESLIVTTPTYIKALNKTTISKDLKNQLFFSSTAPLSFEETKEFLKKFNTNLIQLFGSTESGGVAYKKNLDRLWKPLEMVEISKNSDNLLVVKSPFISNLVFEKNLKETNSKLQTFDMVEIFGEGFNLIGRNSQIIKVAGKRYSTIEIENIIENLPNINRAVVKRKYTKGYLKDEILDIFVETKTSITQMEIKKALKKSLSNISFSIKLNIVDEIKTTPIGKKVIFY